jgi:hypothetical protein
MKQQLFIFSLCVFVLACSKNKPNLSPQDPNSINVYGRDKGKIFLYFINSSSVPANLKIEGQSFYINNYWPNGPNSCESSTSLPSFTLTEGYHSYSVSNGGRSWTGTFYIRKGDCASLQMD